jgi:flagellar biogenesis protein FliO
MPDKYRELRDVLRSLRWLNAIRGLILVFAFFCCTEWKVFKWQGFNAGFRTAFQEFANWLLYAIAIVPLVGVAVWLLNKIDVRGVGFRIGTAMQSIRRNR